MQNRFEKGKGKPTQPSNARVFVYGSSVAA